MPTHDPVTAIAMRTLEDVVAQAQCGAVNRTWGHRLALSWLVRGGVAADWQAISFWQTIDDPVAWAYSEQGGHDHRISILMGLLDTWYLVLRQPRPSLQQRARWARAYAPDIDMGSGTPQLPCMCNRYQPGERQRIEDHFSAKVLRAFNEGPATVHPREPGWVVRQQDGQMVLEQMTWGFPVVLRGKKGKPLKPKPVNNARFDKLGAFWKRWASQPEHRCLIPAARYAEAVHAGQDDRDLAIGERHVDLCLGGPLADVGRVGRGLYRRHDRERAGTGAHPRPVAGDPDARSVADLAHRAARGSPSV